jgi:hypothetical protein
MTLLRRFQFYKGSLFVALLLLASQNIFAQQTDEEKKLSRLQSKDTLEQLNEVQQKNKYGQIHYVGVAVKMAEQAAEKFVHGSECQASCPEGCCDSGDGLVYEGGLFMLLNTQATLQSKQHEMIARESCAIYNKYANTPKDCSKEVKPFDITKPDSNWYDDKGKCKTGAPAACAVISLFPGSGIFGSKQVNCKKNTENPCEQDFFSTYKSNPDGSISIKSGSKTVKLSMDSFKNTSALISAGIPADLAESLLTQFKVAQNKTFTNVKMIASTNNTHLKDDSSKPVNASQELELVTSREPSSYAASESEAQVQDGLTKRFNGELIHASSSNIFEVMTKRYQKTTESLLP